MPWTASALLLCLFGFASFVRAEEPSAQLQRIAVGNSQKQITFELFPAAQQYKILHSPSLGGFFAEDHSGSFWGNTWTGPLLTGVGFYRLQVVPLDQNQLLTATVLNRLAYGPTPDDLDRVKVIGPEAYIQEQLAPEQIQENLAIDAAPAWEFVTVTGTGSSSTLYVYLTATGEAFIDDLKLVAGTVPESGANLLRNGDFEAPLSTNDWTISANHQNSALTTEVAHSGTTCLRIVASSGGSTKASAIWQEITPALSSKQQYTLSFWYLPASNKTSSLTVRLSGSGLSASASSSALLPVLMSHQAGIDTLRAWHVRRAIESKRQLLEVLLQFCENHFVTEYTKSRDYFDQFYSSPGPGQLGTEMEFRENSRWRQALLDPDCTFGDLLKISAESPAMIIYLDTVTSRGDGKQIANENYARELLELFTFGVDNGYDQNDIVEISKCWTGWRVDLLDSADANNPLAPRLVDLNPNVSVTNLVGVWTFKYRPERHNNNGKLIFPSKRVPDRFGAPYAGRSYELAIPPRTGTNGIQDGYDVLTHLADQPFTQEFISVKLCRLFVHEDFATGYDFTAPNLSAEGRLIRQCMEAWETSTPRKGAVRAVLRTIFNSDLFRSHAGSMQKVKTPLEFVVSALRTLRTVNPNGTATVESDGNIGSILNRMGGMNLFDRAEPDGYPEAAAPWISAGTLSERLRFVQALLIARNQSGRSDAGNSFADPVALMKSRLNSAQWTNADALAGFFTQLLYPAEGEANLEFYRTSATSFLNTADDGVTPSPLSTLAVGSGDYDTRVRGMVAMLLTFPRFQEQ